MVAQTVHIVRRRDVHQLFTMHGTHTMANSSRWMPAIVGSTVFQLHSSRYRSVRGGEVAVFFRGAQGLQLLGLCVSLGGLLMNASW